MYPISAYRKNNQVYLKYGTEKYTTDSNGNIYNKDGMKVSMSRKQEIFDVLHKKDKKNKHEKTLLEIVHSN